MFDYSFIIRTLGTAGEKYQKLLNSIDQLSLKPREVIVVLPEGYKPPLERLGYERFVYTPKGMIAQRVFCLNEIKTKYALFSDDDVAFEPSLVEELAKPIQEGRADVTFPIFADFLPKGLWTKLVMCLTGSSTPMLFSKNRYTKINYSGAYSYNPYIKQTTKGEFSAETAPGLCFLISKHHMIKLHFEDELWLQDCDYAWPDDQVMFYKLHLQGKKIIGVGGLDFIHLDAGGNSAGRAVKTNYAIARNKEIFWHRFIFSIKCNSWERCRALCAHKWHLARSGVFGLMKLMVFNNNIELRQATYYGKRDAKLYLKSDKYHSLPSICCNDE